MFAQALLGTIKKINVSSVSQRPLCRLFSVQIEQNNKKIFLKYRPVWTKCEQIRFNSTKKSLISDDGSGSEVSTSVAESVKETTKTLSYTAVIISGVALTTFLFFLIFKELFSSKSPNSVYSRAMEKCAKEPKVLDALGEPIKGFGEETRRGRRRHVSHRDYEVNGVKHMRMRFYLQGSRKSATVHLEVKEDDSSNFVYRYLFVELDDYPHRVIILEDNRLDMSNTLAPTPLGTGKTNLLL